MNQKTTFLEKEGDYFFERNRGGYLAELPEVLPTPLRLWSRFLSPEHQILEIGCSAGRNLHLLQNVVGCSCHGIDPSSEAIRRGAAQYPSIRLAVGTADKLQFEDDSFDFVLFGFCLYLVDRKLLSRAVAEADRVLKDGGFLGITDFDPPTPTVRPYKHRPGVFSYKMDYSRLFTAYPHYVIVEKISYSHLAESFCSDPQERVSSIALFKQEAYVPVEG